MSPVFFSTAADFRRWLETHHDTATELLVGYYKVGSGRPSMTWPESVDQALCFGWIDGVHKRIDDESYTIRFTPRRPRSTWSAVNVRRAIALKELGLMHPAGLRMFEGRTAERSAVDSYEEDASLPGPAEKTFRANPAAWKYFDEQPPGYRRVAVQWVMSAKREETRVRRLATLIRDSANGRRIAAYTLKKTE